MSYEQPDYKVIEKAGDIEYRLYEPYLVAETVIQTDSYRAAGNEGFRRLFGYISGNNTSQAKISMTVPVEQSRGGEKIDMTVPVEQANSSEGWRIAFTLPAKYSIDNAPKPLDERVTVREVPSRVVAALRFSGRWTEANFAVQRERLRAVLETDAVAVLGEFQSAVYNGPFSLPFMRRNEIHVPVDRVPARAAETARRVFALQ